MVSHPERETDTREDSLPMTTESIEKDITEIVAEGDHIITTNTKGMYCNF
jgi:hypothetical protein